jgi:hypothetical protein
MAIASGPCPHCGSTIEFRAGTSVSLACRFCGTIVVRTDRDLQAVGRVADVAFSDVGLAPGDRGRFRGRSFLVEGRLVLRHPAGGVWEEYYVVFDDGEYGWVSEAQGRWHVVTPRDESVPPYADLVPGSRVRLGDGREFVVQERNSGVFLSAEGELPFPVVVGETLLFVDLSGPEGSWATIDVGDGGDATQLFLGFETTFAEFEIQRREDYRPTHQVKTEGVKCPSCGAPLPVLNQASERAACRHCDALCDLQSLSVIAKQHRAREEPGIELGRRGKLFVPSEPAMKDVEWVVLAYLERSGGSDSDDWHGWQEYLLYNEAHGYRWLIYDESQFFVARSVPAAEIDTNDRLRAVVWRAKRFRHEYSQSARVDHVVGEVYWKVVVGETVDATDYKYGNSLLSCEEAAGEINWSLAEPVRTSEVKTAFGFETKGSPYGVQSSSSRRLTLMDVLVLLAVFFILCWLLSLCVGDRDDGAPAYYGPSIRGGSGGSWSGGSGGFGGK